VRYSATNKAISAAYVRIAPAARRGRRVAVCRFKPWSPGRMLVPLPPRYCCRGIRWPGLSGVGGARRVRAQGRSLPFEQWPAQAPLVAGPPRPAASNSSGRPTAVFVDSRRPAAHVARSRQGSRGSALDSGLTVEWPNVGPRRRRIADRRRLPGRGRRLDGKATGKITRTELIVVDDRHRRHRHAALRPGRGRRLPGSSTPPTNAAAWR
jgi:hypothetical protein